MEYLSSTDSLLAANQGQNFDDFAFEPPGEWGADLGAEIQRAFLPSDGTPLAADGRELAVDGLPKDEASFDLHFAWLKHGDRATQFLSLYPTFQSFRGTHGIVRYQSVRGMWVAATEPLAAPENRVFLAEEFFAEAKRNGINRVIFLPVGREFARALGVRGWSFASVGSEARFRLQDHPTEETLDRLGSARSWGRKGAVVEAFATTSENLRSPEGRLLRQAVEDWKKTRTGPSLGFLNQVSPWLYLEQKRIWVLRYAKQIQAFVVAVPIPGRHGYFFSEYIRLPQARAGMLEFLFLEIFAMLRESGTAEVSLGLSPFAPNRSTDDVHGASKWQKFWYERIGLPFSFRSLREFKAKFAPTLWDEQYLVASQPVDWRTWWAVATVHLPGGIGRSLAATAGEWIRDAFLSAMKPRWCAQVRWSMPRPTLALVSAALVLHGLKDTFPAIKQLFDVSGFVAGREGIDAWLQGWVLGPLFHNHAFHLLGDLSSLLVFGALAEAVGGLGFWAAVTAAGLWASNPVTVAILKVSLLGSPEAWSRLLAEVDYGTSNAVYSLVGALGMTMKNPRWLLLPFALNGLFLCFAKESLLALHHLVALGLGMGIALAYEWRSSKRVRA